MFVFILSNRRTRDYEDAKTSAYETNNTGVVHVHLCIYCQHSCRVANNVWSQRFCYWWCN